MHFKEIITVVETILASPKVKVTYMRDNNPAYWEALLIDYQGQRIKLYRKLGGTYSDPSSISVGNERVVIKGWLNRQRFNKLFDNKRTDPILHKLIDFAESLNADG